MTSRFARREGENLILLKLSQLEQISNRSREIAPNEACGLLGGSIDGERRIVEKVYLLTNVDNSPEHFTMDPKEQFVAVKDMRKNGWTLLGNFHSHPASPSRPSEEDKRLAFDPQASYLILSLLDKPVLKSFKIEQGVVSEEEIAIVEEA